MIKGLIFDMDGLMTDTERLFIDIWCQIMQEKGLPEYRDVVTYCIGQDHNETFRYVSETIGTDFPYMDYLMEVGSRSVSYCREHGVPVKPGLYELLQFLDEKGIPYAVATSTKGQMAQWRLDNIGVLDRLHALVTGDMVSKGKPHPEIFLRAAELLELPPDACMVLEDSPHGILAAHRAGCKPVMVPDLKQPDEEIRSMLFGCLDSLLDVPEFILANT